MSGQQSEESNRIRILDFITANPGAHLRLIKRELNLAMGVVQYHLYRLEKDRGIISRRGGLHKRFYPSLGLGPEERDILSVLSQETERDLVLHLLKNPGASQKELSEFAGISPASINWHMNRLAKTGLVEARREGPFVLYTVKVEPARILTLLKNYHPRIWERWSERLADLLS